MISALMKKLVSTEESAERTFERSNRWPGSSSSRAVPAGVSPIGAGLRRKFASGIDYNMKILIRGDRNTGKTSLWRRLQGMPFLREEEGDSYTQTEEIQVASITWSYRAHDFVVKLDVWDVVDKGRRANPSVGAAAPLKIGTTHKSASQPVKGSATDDIPSAVKEVILNAACDANTVNVYNGCDGVVMLFDVTRDWTFAYIRRELPTVPAHIPVLVMANKMDLVSPDQPTPSTIDECLQFLRAFNERCKSGQSPSSARCPSLPLSIRFVRASMKRAWGLNFLYNFFNIPFLRAQQTLLKNAMEANLRELRIAEDELDTLAQEEGKNLMTGLAEGGKSGEKEGGQKTRETEEEEEEAEEERAGGQTEGGGKSRREEWKSGVPISPTEPRHRPASLSSSSEDANPHVSNYAEDFDDAQNDQLQW